MSLHIKAQVISCTPQHVTNQGNQYNTFILLLQLEEDQNDNVKSKDFDL
jgi:hypothetical protein